MGDFEQISEPGLGPMPGEGLGPDVTLADFARTGRISQVLAGRSGREAQPAAGSAVEAS
jgi:hypothetical protein